MATVNTAILGQHPGGDWGESVVSEEKLTDVGKEHRCLTERTEGTDTFVSLIRESLVRHHVDPLTSQRRVEAMQRRGYGSEQENLSRFPTNTNTRKGNLGEVVLAEYLCASTSAEILVYKLRYNPNVEQAMKGDDVLIFDLSESIIKILIGEAKFRSTSRSSAVSDIVSGLNRSHQSGFPVSISFIIDRLFDAGDIEKAERILESTQLSSANKADLLHVGFLLSTSACHRHISTHEVCDAPNVAFVSLGIDDPNSFVSRCYDLLDDDV